MRIIRRAFCTGFEFAQRPSVLRDMHEFDQVFTPNQSVLPHQPPNDTTQCSDLCTEVSASSTFCDATYSPISAPVAFLELPTPCLGRVYDFAGWEETSTQNAEHVIHIRRRLPLSLAVVNVEGKRLFAQLLSVQQHELAADIDDQQLVQQQQGHLDAISDNTALYDICFQTLLVTTDAVEIKVYSIEECLGLTLFALCGHEGTYPFFCASSRIHKRVLQLMFGDDVFCDDVDKVETDVNKLTIDDPEFKFDWEILLLTVSGLGDSQIMSHLMQHAREAVDVENLLSDLWADYGGFLFEGNYRQFHQLTITLLDALRGQRLEETISFLQMQATEHQVNRMGDYIGILIDVAFNTEDDPAWFQSYSAFAALWQTHCALTPYHLYGQEE